MSKPEFRKIPAAELQLGMYVKKLGSSWFDHPFFRRHFLLKKQEEIEKILAAGIAAVWIDETKGLARKQHNGMPEVKLGPSHYVPRTVPPHPAYVGNATSFRDELHRAKRICSNAGRQVKTIFSDVRMGRSVDAASVMPLVEEITHSISRHAMALISVARLKTHDDYTYLHSVAVCTLMIALARQLELSEEQVALAGLCGLMHDLGKAFTPPEILNKLGKLTAAEFDIIKYHPVAGANALKMSNMAWEVQDVALHHHEKINGQGYPDGLSDDISLLARMAACCDVYDAVTSYRPYKAAWSPACAVSRMAQWQGHFDPVVFQAFIKTVGIFPVGSLVRLSNDNLAVVVQPNEAALLLPKVREFYSTKSACPTPLRMIDLSRSKLHIIGPEDPAEWRFAHLDKFWLDYAD